MVSHRTKNLLNKKMMALIFVFIFSMAALNANAELTNKKTAMILFNFQNNQQQPYTADQAKSVANTVEAFYKENSFNKLNVDIDIYGWYTIPYSNSSCNYDLWSNAASALATQNGININNYDNVIYAFPSTSSCKWTGLSQFAGKKSWNNGRMTLGIVAHEFGHNLGMEHSNTYRCFDSNGQRVTISNDCRSYEYTDPYDIMGSGTFSTNYAAHTNNFQKGSLGWFSSSNTATVTQSGTYTLYANELSTSNTQALRILRDTDSSGKPRYYYLEYRKAYGFDNYWRFQGSSPAVNGVTLRLAPDYSAKGSHTYLLDTTPETLSFEDAPLLTGKTFTDSEKGISITPVSRTSDSITVQITMNPVESCTRRNPSLDIVRFSSDSSGVKYKATLKNNDETKCGASDFSVIPTLPAGLVQSPRWISVSSLAPGNSITFSLTVSGTATGALSQKATNLKAPSYYTIDSITYP